MTVKRKATKTTVPATQAKGEKAMKKKVSKKAPAAKAPAAKVKKTLKTKPAAALDKKSKAAAGVKKAVVKDAPVVKVKAVKTKAITAATLPKRMLAQIMQAITDKLPLIGTDGVLAAIQNADVVEITSSAKINKVKTTKVPNKKAAPSGPMFVKPGRDFGFSLKQSRKEPADLKEAFKTNLAKCPKEMGVKMAMFNKLVTWEETFIIAGLRKKSGVWTFTGYNAAGKAAEAPVESVVAF